MRDKRPWDVARNVAIDLARNAAADWLIQIDNDNLSAFNPLDMTGAAGKDKDVLGVDYAGYIRLGLIRKY